MRKLLNTLYVTKEEGYLSLDGENVVLSEKGKEIVRLPFTNLESIVCFNYLGCSPALMGKCCDLEVNLSFVSNSGRFLARVVGETKGNVFSRIKQIEKFSDTKIKINLIKNTIRTKIRNTRKLIMRSKRDIKSLQDNVDIIDCLENLNKYYEKVEESDDIDILRGIEGQCARLYFNIFDNLIIQQKEDFSVKGRTKRPPLDKVNAVLSFLYTICTNDIASALECVGIDPYIGYFHTLRPGRYSLACDLVEEFRCIIERLTITLINLRIINKNDFEEQVSGAVFLNEEGRKKVIIAWQNKKKEEIRHPILKEKVSLGLFPYVQANLFAKFIRGDIEEYPNLEIE